MGAPLVRAGRLLAVVLVLCLHPLAAATLSFLVTNRTQGPLGGVPVYLTVTALDPEGRFQWMDAEGTFHPCRPEDAVVPRGDRNWCVYSFPLADFAMDVGRPVISGRLYLSLGGPLYLNLDAATGGLVQPNPANPTDPNAATPYDWVEFTVDGGGFHGNTTCVDQWCLPIRLEVWDRMGGSAGPVGLEASRADLLRAWSREVPEPFRGLADPGRRRILAPGHASPGSPLANLLDGGILALWERWRTEPVVFAMDGATYTGRVGEDGALTFTGAGSPGPIRIPRPPTTLETFRCDGVLAQGDPLARALGARVGALLNRHPLTRNEYAAFWHRHGLDGLAYGFPYDDVDGRSTYLSVPDPAEVRIAFRID
jgi:beta-galactosidase